MTNSELSYEFDILYNSITSNQAPGLDEYEKSVFLTKAQDEIVKSYFNPRLNKTQEGFDNNERRQIDFSMITKVREYIPILLELSTDSTSTISEKSEGILSKYGIILNPNYKDNINGLKITETKDSNKIILHIRTNNPQNFFNSISNKSSFILDKAFNPSYSEQEITLTPFLNSFFDLRDNTKAVVVPSDILMIINEYTEVTRSSEGHVRLSTIPVSYTEYSRLMSKPFKRPVRNQSWRLLDNSNDTRMSEIVIGPNDVIAKYVLRYIRRPRAIRLTTFDDNVTLDGDKTEQSCELDPILHSEILQRAVELAKASYTGDLQSQIVLGQASQTEIGAVQSNR